MLNFRTPNPRNMATSTGNSGPHMFGASITTSTPYFPFQAPKFGQNIQMTPISTTANAKSIQPNDTQISNQYQAPNYFDTQLEFASLAINSQHYQYQTKSKKSDNNQCALENVNNNAYEIQKYKNKKENETLQKDVEITQLKSELETFKSENEILQKEKNKIMEEIECSKKEVINEEEYNEIKDRLQKNQMAIEKLDNSVNFFENEFKKMKKYEKYLKQEKEQLKINLKNFKSEGEFIQHHYKKEINKLTHDIQNRKLQCEHLQEMSRKFELEKIDLHRQIENLMASSDSREFELKKEIEKQTLRIEEKNEEQKQYELKFKEIQDKIKDNEEKNNTLKDKLVVIEEMMAIELQLNAKIVMLEQEMQKQKTTINQQEQEISSKHDFLVKQCERNKKLENESYNMAEDLKKLYFEVKQLKAKIKDLNETKSNLILTGESLKNELNDATQENKKLIGDKEELIKKMQTLEETQSSIKDLTDKLSILIQNKDSEYERIVREKDELIQELRRQNAEYVEKIKQVQLEKEKVFRNFHEMMLTSFKATPSVSTVSPINDTHNVLERSSQTGGHNLNTSSQTNLKTLNHICSPLHGSSKQAESNSSNILEKKYKDEEMIEYTDKQIDVIPATQSPFKAISTTTNVFPSTPVKLALKESNESKNTVSLTLPSGTPRKQPVAKSGILSYSSRGKRKLNTDSKTSKIVRFTNENEDQITEEKTLSHYTRSRDMKGTSTGVDMSFVKHQLDAQNINTNNNNNKTYSKNKDKLEKDDSWIDDIFNF